VAARLIKAGRPPWRACQAQEHVPEAGSGGGEVRLGRVRLGDDSTTGMTGGPRLSATAVRGNGEAG
jgi:hypothetical protein